MSETHRSYDALQYPIFFWQGEDGYHFSIEVKVQLQLNNHSTFPTLLTTLLYCNKKIYLQAPKLTKTFVHWIIIQTDDNGRSTIANPQDVEVDNRWIVLFLPLPSKIFKAHINVEFCYSEKCIKYTFMYENKRTDKVVFWVAAENVNHGITHFQMGRYVSSNKAMWRIVSFAINERHPTVIHLTVHLENVQRV